MLSLHWQVFAPANAQSNNINGKNEPFQSNERNPFYGDGINPLDIIHNANFSIVVVAQTLPKIQKITSIQKRRISNNYSKREF